MSVARGATTGSVLGIDVGCSPVRRSSAACRLDWDGLSVSWTIERFRATEPERSETIARVIGGRALLCAAFDGPLRTGFDIIGTYRAAERMLTRKLRPFIGKPGQSSTPVGIALNQSANDCAAAVIATGRVQDATHDQRLAPEAIVEAFPSSFLGLLIEEPQALNARRADRSDVFYRHLALDGALGALVRHLLPNTAPIQSFALVADHDERAALICALTALAVAMGDFTAVGDANGWIILPPRSLIRSWAWPLLVRNAEISTELSWTQSCE